MEIITKKCKFTVNEKTYKMDMIILYPYEKLENIRGTVRVKNIKYDEYIDVCDLNEPYKNSIGAVISFIINEVIKSHTKYDKNFISSMVGDNELNEKIFYLSFGVSSEIMGRRLLLFNMDDNGNYFNLKKVIEEQVENK